MQNYNAEMERLMAVLPQGTPLLLHACCGPCASAVLQRLCAHFAVTVYFYNPNMDTAQEYERRRQALETVVQKTPAAWPITLLAEPYDSSDYKAAVQGLEGEAEGGARCGVCFMLRMAAAARKAALLGIEWYTTSLTVSPHKNAPLINDIGVRCAAEQNVSYLPSDFKKKNGYKQSVELSAQYEIYRQSYCGCEFSRRI